MNPELIFPELCQEIVFQQGAKICRQYEEVVQMYLLKMGTINIYVGLDQPQSEVLVGQSDLTYTPIGWSGFITPGRYTSTIVAGSEEVILFKCDFDTFRIACSKNHDLLRFVVNKVFGLMGESIIQHRKYAFGIPHAQDHPQSYQISPVSTRNEALRLIQKSPFFSNVGPDYHKKLSGWVEKRQYGAGETIYSQGSKSEGVYLLVQGRVILSRVDDAKDFYPFRAISTPGFLVGWTSLLHENHIVQAVAQRETMLYYLPQWCIDEMSDRDRDFGKRLQISLLWLFSNLLQVIRGRLIQQRTDKDNVAIQNLIEHNRAKFKLSSQIHAVPHLLDHRDTIGMGLDILYKLNDQGERAEKQIASVCLDLLNDTKREHMFYTGLQQVYNTVANSTHDLETAEIRALSAEAFVEACKWMDYRVEGLENLPEDGGNIFIYNHILNNPHYTLPNNFQITLDSHFISSMILYKKYADPGLRIVRIGKGTEYAHQEYYRKLGYINVVTHDSDESKITPEEKAKIRESFLSEAKTQLESGNNIVISPEGVSNSTEDSPGELKPGAFRLAAAVEGCRIVPITLAYFDRRISESHFGCSIHKPINMEDHVKDSGNRSEMKIFLTELQATMKKQISDTMNLNKRITAL